MGSWIHCICLDSGPPMGIWNTQRDLSTGPFFIFSVHCQFFFPFINLFFIASGYHTMFQKQLPIFTVSFPKSSKYLPVLFVTYTPSYREGQKGYFPLWYRRETRAREKPAPLWSPWDRSQEGWIKACEVSCTSRRISLGVIDLFL